MLRKFETRLCVAGQNDSDLGKIDMAVDAPPVGLQSLLLALQVSLNLGWNVSVGDICAAFLNGIPAPRKLYFHQSVPFSAGQIVEVIKNVFGLSTKPEALADEVGQEPEGSRCCEHTLWLLDLSIVGGSVLRHRVCWWQRFLRRGVTRSDLVAS